VSTGGEDTPFYDRAAATYDRLMATPQARRMRRRFLALVRSNAPPPGPILDFGCGTGIDARYFACTGYRVLAYDPSLPMLAPLQRRCAGAIRTGRVVAVSGSAGTCVEAARALAPFGCITANFGAFNHVDEPDSLLLELAGLLSPDGRVVLSLLNPWYWRDMRSGWWWRSRLASLGKRGFVVAMGENRTVRHEPTRIGRGARFHRLAYYGALRGGVCERLPGRIADPLVFVVLARP
jgi:SAM-dependent methyltransferase